MKADIYPAAHDSLHRWGLAQRRRVRYGSGGLWLAPPEYVILRKLEFWREGGSEKHLRDVSAMLAADVALDRVFLGAELAPEGSGRSLAAGEGLGLSPAAVRGDEQPAVQTRFELATDRAIPSLQAVVTLRARRAQRRIVSDRDARKGIALRGRDALG